jgi:hypothetical protein
VKPGVETPLPLKKKEYNLEDRKSGSSGRYLFFLVSKS